MTPTETVKIVDHWTERATDSLKDTKLHKNPELRMLHALFNVLAAQTLMLAAEIERRQGIENAAWKLWKDPRKDLTEIKKMSATLGL